MAEKKISFGFSKLKKPALLPGVNTVKKPEVELIKCLEGHEIKILGPSIEAAKPLVIPKLANTMTSAALASLKSLKNTIEGVDEVAPSAISSDSVPTANGAPQTLDQKAAHEILRSLQEQHALEAVPDQSLVLRPLTADELPLDGAKESTMNDYEEIPIKQFGLAMLRGMGWKDEEQSKDKLKNDGPVLRPRGMGLGADKMIKPKALLVQPAQGEVLAIRKGAAVRLLSGKFKDNYGTIESMDDHAGRVLVKMAVGSSKEWLNEFMVQPVSRQEYAKFGKVINSAKYEEYKILQDKKLAMQKAQMEQEDVPLSGDVQIVERRSHVHTISDSDSDRDHRKPSSSTSRRSRSTDHHKPNNTQHRTESRRQDRCASPEWGKTSTSRRSRSLDDYRSTKADGRREERRDSRTKDDKSDCDTKKSSSHHESRHKKSSHKKSSKHKKQSKSKSRRRTSSSSSASASDSTSDDERRPYKKHTKKSKRQRSRSRSRQRR